MFIVYGAMAKKQKVTSEYELEDVNTKFRW